MREKRIKEILDWATKQNIPKPLQRRISQSGDFIPGFWSRASNVEQVITDIYGALPGKMLLVRIIENNKIDAYFRSGQVK